MIPFGVMVAGRNITVIFRRASDGQEDTHIAATLGDKFNPSHSGHKLMATNSRVRRGFINHVLKRRNVAVFVYQFMAFEKIPVFTALFLPLD